MATDWNIRPRDDRCAACDVPFEDAQVCRSVLRFDDEEGYGRQDYCEPCWQTGPDSDKVVSTWRGIFRMPPPPAAEPVERATAESLLRKLMEDHAASHANVIYILAVMLERKRVLIERAANHRPDGNLVRVYEHRRSGETFSIRDPRLGLSELEPVQQEVITMLEALNPPAEEPPEAEPQPEPKAEDAPVDDASMRGGFYQRNA